MSRKHTHIAVREGDRIYKESEVSDPAIPTISATDFHSLAGFILDNSDNADIALAYFRQKGKEVIRFRNYVGVIETKSGLTIEILPKIDHPEDIREQRRLFLTMLRHLKKSPFKSIREAHLNTREFPVFEIFITAFLAEMDKLVQKGVKRAYREKEENLNCAKGRIHIPAQLSQNLVHKEKFYVHYDEFSLDIPQNRILKTSFHYLLHRSRLHQNKIRLKQYLQVWDAIPFSKNMEADFRQTNGLSRLYSHYEKPLQWAKVFLKEESFTNFRGKSVNTALLFPMERIFEDYAAAMFRKYLNDPELTVLTQDRRKYLVDNHIDSPEFRLKPDMVIEKNGKPVAILDTKWKAIDGTAAVKHYGIVQSDMYQLYAYGRKYGGNPLLFLIYPENENFKNPLPPFSYQAGSLELHVIPFRMSRNRRAVEAFVDGVRRAL